MNWGEHRSVLVVSALLVAVFALVDFRSRIFVGRDRALREFIAPQVKFALPVVPRDRVLSDLTKWVGQDPATQVRPREIVLQGIFFVGSVPRAALSLVAVDGRPPQRVKVGLGDEVEGWKIEAIEARRLLISRDSESRELVLFKRR